METAGWTLGFFPEVNNRFVSLPLPALEKKNVEVLSAMSNRALKTFFFFNERRKDQ